MSNQARKSNELSGVRADIAAEDTQTLARHIESDSRTAKSSLVPTIGFLAFSGYQFYEGNTTSGLYAAGVGAIGAITYTGIRQLTKMREDELKQRQKPHRLRG